MVPTDCRVRERPPGAGLSPEGTLALHRKVAQGGVIRVASPLPLLGGNPWAVCFKQSLQASLQLPRREMTV